MSDLKALVAAELDLPAPPAATALADGIRERHGDAVAAVIFYGSCLRKQTAEGVLDFYVLVDSYRAALMPGWQARLGRALPPNVYYLEAASEAGTVRCKYAVISSTDFERCVSPRCLHPYIWSRFAQPSLLVYARNADVRLHVVECAAQAIKTLVQRLSGFLPLHGRVQRFSYAAFWQMALARTYSSEFRGEQPETIRSLYESNTQRYDQAAGLALDELLAAGWLDAMRHRGPAVEIEMPAVRRRAARWRWTLLRPLSKATMLLRLLKTAFTFGDWLPYALWKVERHSGMKIEPTDRQRAHPLLYGWPVIARVLWSRTLR